MYAVIGLSIRSSVGRKGLMKNENLNNVNPLKAVGVYEYDKKKEDAFIFYKEQILLLYKSGKISFKVANVAMCIVRKKLGLPFLCIYPVLDSLDNITL